MKRENRFLLLAILPVLLLACQFTGEVRHDVPVTKNAPRMAEVRVTGTPPVASREKDDSEYIASAFTRCVTASNALWIRTKPWATAPLALPNALLAGTKVEIYLSPFGAKEWLEVWVPSEGVTGYVNTNYIGSCNVQK